MKKFLMIAAACVALASCVKNEVGPVVVDNSPIGFQAVQSLEQTRALGDFTGPDFVSYAYLLQSGQTWGADKATAQPFFAGQVVTESTVDTDGDSVFEWTTATAYYWPEQGSLTFYAYSPSSISSPTIPSIVNTDGMKFVYNDDTYPNVDFMVADVEKDKTANNVPAIFRHKLTKVGFKIAKQSDQVNRTIRLTNVEFNNLANEATFTQTSDGISGNETWSDWGAYTNDYPNQWTGDQVVNTTAAEITLEKKLFIPQNLANDAEIKITYIVETNINGVISEETVVEAATFDEIHGAEAVWNKNAYMVYTLTIGDGNRIYWAPKEYSWDDAITPGTII